MRIIFARFPDKLRKDGFLRKSGQAFHDKLLLGRCFRGFVLSVLEYCTAVWCSAAAHLKLLYRAVSEARFLTGGLFECDIAHRRCVAVLFMLYKMNCNPLHPLNGALLGSYVRVRVTCGTLVADRYTYAPPRCRTSQHRRNFIPSQCRSGTILLTPCSLASGLAGFKSRAKAFSVV